MSPARIWREHEDSDGTRILEVAKCLRDGGLVVFPTETVYGLGANALDAAAVASIFRAKGRPPHNPLIVHVADVQSARELAAVWPNVAQVLAEAFWPGPLSMVLARNDRVPDVVTAGGPTVALRCPNHRTALDLIRHAGVPVAAPSANPSGYVSPTRVEFLAEPIEQAADWILDAGPCHGGIESTVLDLTVDPPSILRPGLLSREDLARVLGPAIAVGTGTGSAVPRSPGVLGRHYAPSAQVVLVPAHADAFSVTRDLAANGHRCALLTFGSVAGPSYDMIVVTMPRDARAYGRELYRALADLDRRGVRYIVVEEPPDTVEWEAVRDRLQRAALG